MTACRTLGPLSAMLLLGACGGSGPSVSGEASEVSGSNSGLSGVWKKDRGVGVDESKTVEMPALELVAEAFQAGAIGKAFGPIAGELLIVRDDNNTLIPLPRRISQQTEQFSEDWPIANAGLKKAAGSPDHLAHALPLIAATSPRSGWEVNAMAPNPAFDDPFFRKNGMRLSYDEQLHRRYMEMLAASAIFANDVFGTIAKKLRGVRLADTDESQTRVLAAYRAIPAKHLRTMFDSAVEQVSDGRFTTDATGSGNIHFIHSAAGDFVAGARGLTWTRAGGTWFGDGRINGQAVNFRLASTASMSQRQSQSGTQGTNADASVRGAGSVGTGR